MRDDAICHYGDMIIGVDLRVLASGQHSGIQEYTEQVVRHMVDLDATISWRLISLGRQGVSWRPWFDAPNVTRVHSGIPSSLAWLSSATIGRPRLDEVAGGVDVMFFPHFVLGGVSARCPVVSTWHDMSYEMMPRFLSPRQRFWHSVQMMPRWQAHRAQNIICVSHSTARDVESRYGVCRDRISVVHSGVDASFVRVDDEDVRSYRQARGLPERFILTLGTIELRKNLEMLVAAFEEVATKTSHDLVIAGSYGWQSEFLLRRIAASPVSGRIRVIGAVEPHLRALLVNSADVVVYPSYLEGFGFPPLEALACGVPVVASHTSAIAEVAGQWAVLVDPYRAQSIATGLLYALEDKDWRSRVRMFARIVRETYSWDTTAQKTLEVLTRSVLY